MLPRPSRLRRSEDIKQVLHHGRCLTTPYLRICTLPSVHPPHRVAVIVGKKVSLSAVKRHRYQRWLRVMAAETITSIQNTRVYDMVWIAQPAIKNFKKSTDLRHKINNELQRLISKL